MRCICSFQSGRFPENKAREEAPRVEGGPDALLWSGMNMNLVGDVKATVDLTDIVAETVKLTRRGPRFWGLCPFHNEKTASFSVDPNKQRAHCFGCGWSGDAIDFLMKRDGLEFKEALQALAGRAGMDLRATKANTGPIRSNTRPDPKLIESLKAELQRQAGHERFLHSILRTVQTEQDLERPLVVSAIKALRRIEQCLDQYYSAQSLEEKVLALEAAEEVRWP